MSKTVWWAIVALAVGVLVGGYLVSMVVPPAAKPGPGQFRTDVPSPGQPGTFPNDGYMKIRWPEQLPGVSIPRVYR